MSIREAATDVTRAEVAAQRSIVMKARWRLFMRVADGELQFFENLNLADVTALTEAHQRRLTDLLKATGVTEGDRTRLLELAQPLPDRDQAHLRRELARPAMSPEFKMPDTLPATPSDAIELIWRMQDEGCPTPREVFATDEPDEEAPRAATA